MVAPRFAAYYIISNQVQARWERMLKLQLDLWPAWLDVKKVFVVNEDYKYESRFPKNAGDVVRIKLFDDKGHILFARAKNTGLRWAETHQVDWILDADADSVIVKPPDREPSTPYSSMLCHFQGELESLEEVEKKARAGKLQLRHFSRFLLHRNVFANHKFDEEFFGYAGEDVDYHLNLVQHQNVQWSDCGMAGINLYHAMGERRGNLDRLKKKRG